MADLKYKLVKLKLNIGAQQGMTVYTEAADCPS